MKRQRDGRCAFCLPAPVGPYRGVGRLICLLAPAVLTNLGAQARYQFSEQVQGPWFQTAEIAPREFGSDLLIRAAVVAQANGPERSKMLIRAFDLANSAARVSPDVLRAPAPLNSRTACITKAAQLGLDRLSLQCRAAMATLDSDFTVAVSLWERIQLPRTAAVSCADHFFPEFSPYYRLVRRLLSRAQSGAEKARIVARVVDAQNPFQLAPAAQLLSEAGLDSSVFAELVKQYAESLRAACGGAPAFYHAVVGQRLAVHVEALGQKCGGDLDLREALGHALREFLTGNLSAPGCHESFLPEIRREIYQAAVEPFNQRLRMPGQLSRGGLPPIDFDQIWPSDVDNTRPSFSLFWQHPEAAGLRAALFGGDEGESGLTVSPLPTAEAVHRLRGWLRPDDMPEEEFFHQKVSLYQELAAQPRAAPLKLGLINDLAGFIAGSAVQSSSPAEWLWRVVTLARDEAIGKDVLQAMGETGSPVLRVYVELERRTGALSRPFPEY